jgi:hypothetical protein
MPKDPLAPQTPKKVNPLYRNTEKETESEPKAATIESSLPQEDTQSIEQQTVQPPIITPSHPEKPPVSAPRPKFDFDLPPGPAAKRRRGTDKRYAEKHKTISLSVDARIANEVDDFLNRGAIKSGNKTVFASQLFLRLLLDAGYDIDPEILSQPD